MTRQHGVQCKACGQSISIGIADAGLPIPLGLVHCLYCRQERVCLEQGRIKFDADNGLALVGPA
jgi:hypothetical protein